MLAFATVPFILPILSSLSLTLPEPQISSVVPFEGPRVAQRAERITAFDGSRFEPRSDDFWGPYVLVGLKDSPLYYVEFDGKAYSLQYAHFSPADEDLATSYRIHEQWGGQYMLGADGRYYKRDQRGGGFIDDNGYQYQRSAEGIFYQKEGSTARGRRRQVEEL
ncbi:hypothetical protein FOL47_006812 [Perkinsus chesapeaki]|uniref:Uncharacterized protein n=1 Tax=Perkinsus chesapeaki TaxID=330153 RepID=A0A7J6MWM2_PERCH|nr:hypothetical protein FOL47_006812 [Perkinsus chesapeaki]